MTPQRRTSQGACATPPTKKRATGIVVGHALGVTRPSGRRDVATPTALMLSPACTKPQAAPMVSPATRGRNRRKLLTPPRAALSETRVRSSRQVNRRIFDEPPAKKESTSALGEHMLMIQPRILPLPDTSKWGISTQVVAETPDDHAPSENMLIIQPRILPLPDFPRMAAPVSGETSTTDAESSGTEARMTQSEMPSSQLQAPEEREHSHVVTASNDDASSEDVELTQWETASLKDVSEEREPTHEDDETLDGDTSSEDALTLPDESEEGSLTEERTEAVIPATEPPFSPEITAEAREAVVDVPPASLEVAPQEDAPANGEDWWDATYTQHDHVDNERTPTRPAMEFAAAPTAHTESGVWKWTAHLKREAFNWILYYLHKHLEIGCERERAALIRYLEMPQSAHGLFVCGISAQSTGTIIRSLLDSLTGTFGGRPLDVTAVKGELYGSSEEIYSSIRARLKCKWDFPPWRQVDKFMQRSETVPALDPSKLSVIVLENIDPHVKDGDSKQPALDRLLRFLNAHVVARGLKFIVIGHEAKTIRRFSRQFGGFWSGDTDQYMLRLLQYTVKTLSAHIEAVIASAVATMMTVICNDASCRPPSLSSLLTDLLAPKVVQFAAQKALKQEQCELDPVLLILRRALVRMLSACRYRSEHLEPNARLWRLRYEHVTAVTTEFFKHDYVHRIQCVGVIPQTVLLVLIDAGPCTEEQLFQRVWERRLVHSWVMVITTFRSTMFDPALELLLSVPVVKKRETKVCVDGEWRVEQELYALPTREHLIEAAGKHERIRLLL